MRKFHFLSAFAGIALAVAASIIGTSAALAAPADPGISLMQDVEKSQPPISTSSIEVAVPASTPLTCKAPEAFVRVASHDRYVVRRVAVTFANAEILNVAEVRRRC